MEIQSLTKTFSNGVKVFTREIVQDGVRGTRTTVYSNDKLIRDRFKTITSSTTDSGNKLNIITKHTYGQICGELFEKGTYGVLGRLYNKSGLKKLYEIYTAPTHNRKNEQWCGQITEVVGKHLNIRDDINTAFFYNKNKKVKKWMNF